MAEVVMVPGWEEHISSDIDALVDHLAGLVADDARRYAPVRTGELRDSIHTEPSGVVKADADYAGYVELGTRNMAAEPYLRPALYQYRS